MMHGLGKGSEFVKGLLKDPMSSNSRMTRKNNGAGWQEKKAIGLKLAS